MKPNIANPSGYYEDMLAVQLHDELLKNQGTSWQFHGETELKKPSEPFKEYIASRDALTSDNWGLKDPRALLFLDSWNDELLDRGRYLFLIRHWSSCIESLHNRHSRELTFSSKPLIENAHDLIFWQQPELAANMWGEYNLRLQLFLETHSEQCMVVTQKALFEGFPFISELNKRFDLNLNQNVECPINKDYLNESASNNVKNSLSLNLQEKLEEQWNNLLQLADYKSGNELPHFFQSKVFSFPVIESERFEVSSTKNDELQDLDNSTELTSNELINLLEKKSIDEAADFINMLKSEPSLDVVKWIKNKFPTEGRIHFCIGNWFVRNQMWVEAIENIKWAIVLGFARPHVLHSLGICFHQTKQWKIAETFFNRALTHAPKNFAHKIALGRLLVDMGDVEQGLSMFQSIAYKADATEDAVISYANTASMLGRLEEAIPVLQNLYDRTGSQPALNLMITAEFLTDPESANHMYKKSIKGQIADISNEYVAYQIQQAIESEEAKKDLYSRMLAHRETLNLS